MTLQGLAGCLLLLQNPYSVDTVGIANVVFGSSQMDQCQSGLYAVSTKFPPAVTFSDYPQKLLIFDKADWFDTSANVKPPLDPAAGCCFS